MTVIAIIGWVFIVGVAICASGFASVIGLHAALTNSKDNTWITLAVIAGLLWWAAVALSPFTVGLVKP